MGTWALAQAKARFSELVDCVQEQGAQQITRNGKLVGVLVSPEEWRKATRAPAQNARTMSEFFRNSPLAGSGLDLKRVRSRARKIDL